jgi:hypothetical protein
MVITSSPFGGQMRTSVLLALRLLRESYPRELARLLASPLNGVQGALKSLERDGLVVARAAGRTRLVRVNPRYFAKQDLDRYLLTLATADRKLQTRVNALRRRPRRSGKPL